jgi:hypothetical protein
VLDRETILAKRNLKRETVEIPEWNGTILVRELSGAERARYEAGFSDTVQGEALTIEAKSKRLENMRAKIVVLAAINEDGTHIFHDDDVGEVNELSGAALDRIFSAVMRLSGYGKEEIDKAKKNLQDGEASTSSSPLH